MSTNGMEDVERARAFQVDLEEVEKVYRRLLELTRNQSEVLREGVSPELLELVRAKEEELGKLERIEVGLAPARVSWPELRERIPAAIKGEVQSVIGRVEGVLRDLLRLEEEEGRALTARRDETLAQIRRLDSARKVRGAYGAARSSPALLDQKE